MTDAPSTPIENHAVIGDMRTLALVSLDGEIDYLCFPDFDSPSIFLSLLDRAKGGRFRLGGDGDGQMRRQLYLPDTNILFTRFQREDGVGEVSDFMPLDGSGRIIRRAKSVIGRTIFSMECAPRFDYGRNPATVEAKPWGCTLSGGGLALDLHASVPLELEEGFARARFALDENEHAWFVLCPGRPDRPAIDERYVSDSFKATADFWRAWVSRGRFPALWRDTVVRSALALKLLTSSEHGSIAAAGTFGLREVVGGARNWDYRYSWVRDASFTLYAFWRLGYTAESDAYVRFLLGRAAHTGDRLAIMSRMDGSDDLDEVALDHLAGWNGSRPVRIGNGAADQLQLDIYGELLDAIWIASRQLGAPAKGVWGKLVAMLDWLADHWREPDEGIWEVRGGRRPFLSSRLMSWVAFDRGLKIAERFSLPAPRDRWLEERDAVHREIMEAFWNEELGAFVQSAGATALDASALLMPLVGFLNPADPYWRRTMAAIDRTLVRDCLVRRHANQDGIDGLEGEENAFTTCGFWYVEALARGGDIDLARLLFEKLLSYANHVGLYAEELSESGAHLGNFPQALTHLALISAAHYLDGALADRVASP